jgi:hypothetical protein
VIITSSKENFEELAKRLRKSGVKASAPASLEGRSGANHEFAFAAHLASGDSLVVVDTALSIGEVEEIKVLSFYAKVFDLSPAHAVLCVSPKLGSEGRQLAKEYKITVLENEVPKKLVSMAAKHIEDLLRGGKRKAARAQRAGSGTRLK